MAEGKADIAVIGLAVMGQNLVLNMADHGFTVSVFNRTTHKMTDFIRYAEDNEPSHKRLVGCETLKGLVHSLKKPRKIVILVQAGAGTDAVIEQLIPAAREGDIIVDCGNASGPTPSAAKKQYAPKCSSSSARASPAANWAPASAPR